MITAWDPGATTGWAAFKDDGTLIDMDMVPLEDVPEKWTNLEFHHGRTKKVVIEDFRLFRKRAMQQAGSDMPAAQGIGMLRALAHASGSEVIIQAPNKKIIAQKWSQTAIPKDHSETHSVDAYLHGFYYLHTVGLVRTALQIQQEAKAKYGKS